MLIIAAVVPMVVIVVTLFRTRDKIHYWIFYDVKRSLLSFLSRRSGLIHIMFAFVDHFEPGHGGADSARQSERVKAWACNYPALAGKHRDSDGFHPKHTFFFPPHYDTNDNLQQIVNLCSHGYGEIELHLHHDRMSPWPDDNLSLKKKIVDTIESFSRYGVFCLPNGERKFGFIHGDWALANSRHGGKHCGVNDELSILEEAGCYADFTFPVNNEAQPKLANTILYARSNPQFPKGYNRTALPAQVGVENPAGLMLVQGILGLRCRSWVHKFKPGIEQSNIGARDYPFKSRIDYWVNKAIHVKGKPDWVFVKVHTHGAIERDWDVLLGKPCDDMYSYMESKYNDGARFAIHYVSAREMYNIIRAAMDGKGGNPNLYRDHVIPKYNYIK